jgi:DnaK suppressor protein
MPAVFCRLRGDVFFLYSAPFLRFWQEAGTESFEPRTEERMKPLLSPDYRPSETETFMNPMQQEYFRQKLLAWKAELLKESNETLNHLQEESLSEPDIADRASLETDRALELRTRDRERKLISKIDEALLRIEDGTYGYCEETGEPIGIKRLEARPIATLSIEAQERHERMERTHRDD